MSLLFHAGAFIAIERGDRDVFALVKRERANGRIPLTHGGIVGQVWRGGNRQAAIAQILPGLHVAPLDEALGRRAGQLLARARKSDVLDAALVMLATDGDEILTSDPNDLRALAAAAGILVDLIRV